MEKIVLFMDNEPRFLQVQSRILEQAGYQVLMAHTLEGAEKELKEKRIHVAIFDIRMLDEDDEQDVSGLILAQTGEYRSIPKLILTGYPSYEYVREALGLAVDGQPPAVNFLDKDEGPEALVQAVGKVFTQYVRINWKLHIQWAEDQPLSFPGLVSLIEPYLASDHLPARCAEVEDLFRKLFYDYDQIIVSRLIWRKRTRVGLEVFAYSQEREEQFIVTCGRIQDNALERELCAKPASQAFDAGSISIKLTAETTQYAATAFAMGGSEPKEIQSLVTFCRAKPDRQIRSVLEHLFQNTLAPWHQQSLFVEESKGLSQLYRERSGLTEDAFPPADLARRMQALAKEALARNIADITFPSNRVEIKLSGGRSISYPNPIPCLYNDDMLLVPRVICRTTSGGLDVDTILVDQAGRTWLSDFAQAGPAPIGHDFVSLETAIRFELMEVGSLQALYDFEKRLLAARRLNETISSDDIEPEHRKALSAIQTIRRLASEAAGDDPGPYYIGLLFCTAAGLAMYDPTLKRTGPEIARLLHRLLFAAMLCEKIDQMKTKRSENLDLPASKSLRIDEANREAWVGEKRIVLTNTEFDLLLYLYSHVGALCKRSDIAQDVFGLKGENRETEDSLLNTNIGRLREKIEHDLSSPKYIMTVRGQGYKLIVQPE
ncbi:MAG TPA: DNA-binding response regulator [Anaerolineae bacterium]|nr:DNA-binding response regulator [Anaerolineae bacterium]